MFLRQEAPFISGIEAQSDQASVAQLNDRRRSHKYHVRQRFLKQMQPFTSLYTSLYLS